VASGLFYLLEVLVEQLYAEATANQPRVAMEEPAAASKYRYSESLRGDSSDIRASKLIRLIEVTKEFLFRVTCRLVTVSVVLAPDYETIPYTWDGQKPDRYIEFNGRWLGRRKTSAPSSGTVHRTEETPCASTRMTRMRRVIKWG